MGVKKRQKKLGSTSDGDAPAARKLAFKTSSWMRRQVFVSVGVSGGGSPRLQSVTWRRLILSAHTAHKGEEGLAVPMDLSHWYV